MPNKWLQIRGDPSVRAFLFEQRRVDSAFDARIEHVHAVARALLSRKGVFHVKIHYASGQLTCWFARDPFCYQKFLAEDVLAEGFVERFADADHAGRVPVLTPDELDAVFAEFHRLRLGDENVYLRNAAVNLIDGMINLSFSCDGTHYIDHRSFLARLEAFGTPG